MKTPILLIFILMIFSSVAMAQVADSSFGKDGILTGTQLPTVDWIGQRADGKILGYGSAFAYPFDEDHLFLLNDNASVDSSFGKNGSLYFRSEKTHTFNVLIQSDSKSIIYAVLGDTLYMRRLNRNGSIDKTFKSPRFAPDTNYELYNFCFSLQNDNKVIGTIFYRLGESKYQYIFRLNTDGSNDLSFGTDGFVYDKNWDYGEYWYSAISIDSSNRIICTGPVTMTRDSSFGSSDVVTSCYLQNGDLDLDFGREGYTLWKYPFLSGFADHYNYMQILSNGNILIGSGLNQNGYKILLYCYLPNGQLDLSFANKGYLRFQGERGGFFPGMFDIKVSADDQIYVGVTSYIVNFLANGSVNTLFGENGVLYLDRNYSNIRGMDIQKDGKLLLSGYVSGLKYRFFIARYLLVENALPHFSSTEMKSKSASISIYPNPTTNFIKIKGLNEADGEIIISDNSGRIIQKVRSQKETEKMIDLTHLPTGIYYVQLFQSGAMKTFAVLKQ